MDISTYKELGSHVFFDHSSFSFVGDWIVCQESLLRPNLSTCFPKVQGFIHQSSLFSGFPCAVLLQVSRSWKLWVNSFRTTRPKAFSSSLPYIGMNFFTGWVGLLRAARSSLSVPLQSSLGGLLWRFKFVTQTHLCKWWNERSMWFACLDS